LKHAGPLPSPNANPKRFGMCGPFNSKSRTCGGWGIKGIKGIKEDEGIKGIKGIEDN